MLNVGAAAGWDGFCEVCCEGRCSTCRLTRVTRVSTADSITFKRASDVLERKRKPSSTLVVAAKLTAPRPTLTPFKRAFTYRACLISFIRLVTHRPASQSTGNDTPNENARRSEVTSGDDIFLLSKYPSHDFETRETIRQNSHKKPAFRQWRGAPPRSNGRSNR